GSRLGLQSVGVRGEMLKVDGTSLTRISGRLQSHWNYGPEYPMRVRFGEDSAMSPRKAVILMVRCVLLGTLLLGAGCKTTSHERVGVGYRRDLWPCDNPRLLAGSAAIQLTPRSASDPLSFPYVEATAPGSARFACGSWWFRDETIVDVETPVRIEIRFPKRIAVGETRFPDVVGFDAAGGEIQLGPIGIVSSGIDLTTSGAIGRNDLGGCMAPPNPGFLGVRVGTGHIEATYGGLSASIDVDIVAATDSSSE
ncbi:MAG TPA: hypothetical protein VF316_00320, partial [Polyangiaceae bacterium]